MSASWQVDLKDNATPALRAKIAALSPAVVNGRVAPRLVRLTQRKLLAQPHNQRGWRPVNFWAGAARATSAMVLPNGVLLSINQIGVRQRYYGGPIRPVNSKFLTIPCAEESYGKTAADFDGQLQLVVIKGKGAWLALRSFEVRPRDAQRGLHQRQGPALSTLRERLKFLFILSAGVNQEANPNILPSSEDYLREGQVTIMEAI